MGDDLAFVFNDPGRKPPGAPRPSDPPRPRAEPHAARRLPSDIDWRTLRQAHNETSIPISTLRKWAKKGKVRARLVRTEGKDLRLVAFGDVVDRAQTLERVISPVDTETAIDLRDGPDVVVGEVAADGYIAPVATVQSASRAPEPAEEQQVEAAPEGSILVPLDAWDRMLGQLGNLHEAGQQLAESRERAAKAETEAEFLRERLKELRTRMEKTELALELHRRDRLLPEAPPPRRPAIQIGWRRIWDRWVSK